MIKSLFDENTDQSDQNKAEESDVTASRAPSALNDAPQYIEVNEAEDLLENSENIEDSAELENSAFRNEDDFELSDEKLNEIFNAAEPQPDSPVEPISEIPPLGTENFTETSADFTEAPTVKIEESADDSATPVESINQTPIPMTVPFENFNQESSSQIVRSNDEPQSLAETARQSGLAYAAAITLFASVVFMLIIGWFADLLFETSPWGKVGGIALGSLIGFIQLFRITSQIFKNK